MEEQFISYLWKFQYFNTKDLSTTAGQALQVFHTGQPNSDAGPDFMKAHVYLDGIKWVGNIELHIRSSDWHLHRHHEDSAYDAVILHVVWEHDKTIFRLDGSEIAHLEIKELVEPELKQMYAKFWAYQEALIPCEAYFNSVPAFIKTSMIERALISRVERKAKEVLDLFKETGNDWDVCAWQVLLTAFGFKLNAEPMRMLAQALPFKYLQKQGSIFQSEALVFGVSGFLNEEAKDEYHLQLQKEFHFLAAKFSLEKKCLNKSQWKFLRTRPNNFPTIRLAQIAALSTSRTGIFSSLLLERSIKQITEWLVEPVSAYWQTHYDFAKVSSTKHFQIGDVACHSLFINVVAPLNMAYAIWKLDPDLQEKVLAMLEKLPPEANQITRDWDSLGVQPRDAGESQGLIELRNSFCNAKKCLSCKVGAHLLRP
jgi:hypothetical protein